MTWSSLKPKPLRVQFCYATAHPNSRTKTRCKIYVFVSLISSKLVFCYEWINLFNTLKKYMALRAMHPSCMKVFFQSNNLITLVKRETTVLELLIYVSIERMHRTITWTHQLLLEWQYHHTSLSKTSYPQELTFPNQIHLNGVTKIAGVKQVCQRLDKPFQDYLC